jgi:endonuclease/exonuclease/phosphatase family metal-dependent hydrolase|tara:strand:+ start:659 stop:1972 length:1314 start_codon:yes stop_codon:yes gene_type:complete
MFLVLNNIIISQENRFRSLTRNSNQDGLYQEKIMTYNVLHYDGENDRDPFFKEIIGQIEPDLIVCQEINGVDGFNSFFDSVLNVVHPGIWDYADFIDQSANNDIALYFKSEHFSYVSTSMIYTAQTSGTRNVVEWFMVHNATSIQFRIYGVHFKANPGYEERRRVEMTIMRDYLNDLPEQSDFIVTGDFNIYNASTEPGFAVITSPGSDNDGRLFDPLNRIGDWHADVGEIDCEYADIHTQSTRVLDLGDGATGGMDDRFDWILVSASILEETNDINYVDGTYLSFGNDGNHCNQGINEGENSSVSQSIANALHAASDHLPVVASFQFGCADTSTASIMYDNKAPVIPRLYGWYPNPFNLYTTFKFDLSENNFVNVTIRDLLGRHVKTLINQFQYSGSNSVNWNATNANNEPVPSGMYFCILKVGQFEGITKIILLK